MLLDRSTLVPLQQVPSHKSPSPAISHPNSGVTTDPHHALVTLPLTPSSYPSSLYPLFPLVFHLSPPTFSLAKVWGGKRCEDRQDTLPILSSGENFIETPSNVTKENNHRDEKVECFANVFSCVQPIP